MASAQHQTLPFPPYTASPPPPQVTSHRPWPWIVGILGGVIIVPLVLCVIAATVISTTAAWWMAHQVSAEITTNQTYAVTNIPQVRVQDPAGNVQIVAGEANQVTVQLTKRASDVSHEMAQHALSAISVTSQQQGNTITVSGAISSDHPFTRQTIDVLITTPAVTNVVIDDSAGNVTLEHLTGALALTVSAGNILADDMRLTGASSVQINAGNLHLAGALTEGASLDARIDAGNAELYMPHDTSPTVDAATAVGNITVSGFSLPVERHGAGASTKGDLAAASRGSVMLRVKTGNITLGAR